MTEATGRNLTGTWNGLYSYQRGMEPVGFVADLVDVSSWLGGGVRETAPGRDGRLATFHAEVSGRRSGGQVVFVKTYDGTGGRIHSVDYDGTLSQDGTEIEGTWRIARQAAGRFLMIRPEGRALAVARETFARV